MHSKIQNMGNSSRSLRVGFTPLGSQRPHGYGIGKCCSECGHVWPEEIGSGDGFRDHMVTVHGFMRVGDQVFKRRVCHCGKPGLYKVGSDAYCRDHAQLAVDRRVKLTQLRERDKGDADRQGAAEDAKLIKEDAFHRTVSRHK